MLSRELPFLKFVLHLIVKYSFKKTKERENKKEKGKRKKELFSPLVLLAWLAAAILIGYAGIGVLPDWLFYPGEILFIKREHHVPQMTCVSKS